MSYSPAWMNRYMEEKFFNFDPVVLGASASFDPVDWAELDWSEADRHGFREEADGLRRSAIRATRCPVRGPSGQFAIFTINKTC